ncbi:MAG TPA: hypothetical protein VN684_04800 [Terriglobales bacterium]|jgi:hypothetical protein|nr:hypothetical protein [Terriglobales bacterium]
MKMQDPKGMLLTPEQRDKQAKDLLFKALALAGIEAGWVFHASPGNRYFEFKGEQLDLATMIGDLASNKITAQSWREQCRTWGLPRVRFVDLVAGSSPSVLA